jgi:hypothetical protein
MLFGSRAEVGWFSLTYKLPAICEWRDMAEAGCLASYGWWISTEGNPRTKGATGFVIAYRFTFRVGS